MSSGDGAVSLDTDPLSDGNALRQMYRITADHERPFEDKLTDLLELGQAYLNIDAAFLTEITSDTQSIRAARGSHPLLKPGESCPLSKAYCRKTIKQDHALTVQHAGTEGWQGDAAYETFGLESYIGAKVMLDGEIYGTLCFADTEPRPERFTDEEETFVELMAEWVSYELFQHQATTQLKEQRDQLEEFTKVVSHDLRNPLGIIEGYLDLAEQTGEPEHFDRCRDAIDRMDALISDLLVLAHEGDAIAETETIRVADLVEECWSFVTTDSAKLTVETDMVIAGDWSRLQQLFENLFRNALEHGNSDVTVRVGSLPADEGLFVEDSGPGIPPDERTQIFVDGYSTQDDGTGLGLSIVKQIVDAHGWSITVTDSDLGGARFEIRGIETTTQ